MSEEQQPPTTPATKRNKGGPQPGSGRPTKLTPETHALIVQMIRAGNFVETAAAAAGVDRRTVRDWIKRGARMKRGIYAAFHRDATKAAAESEATLVALIGLAANHEKNPQWTAAAWLLERKHPEKWGKRVQVQAEVKPTTGPFEGRTPDALAFYADHGYFPEEAAEGSGAQKEANPDDGRREETTPPDHR